MIISIILYICAVYSISIDVNIYFGAFVIDLVGITMTTFLVLEIIKIKYGIKITKR